jgi:anti-sigma factor RsiW
MECRADVIVEYIALTLDPETVLAFEKHLESCLHCRDAAAAQRAVWRALDAWIAPPVSPDFDQKVFEHIQLARAPLRAATALMPSPGWHKT